MAVRLLSIRLPRDLDEEVMAFARSSGLTRSQAARELLRQALEYPDPVGRGWREGFAKGRSEVLEANARTAHELSGHR